MINSNNANTHNKREDSGRKTVNIPYQNMEIEQIYTQLFSNPHTAIAICSSEQGEGVTSLAFALAQRNLLAGHSTLLVDLNLYRPAIKGVLDINTEIQKTDISNGTSVVINTSMQKSVLSAPQLVFSVDNSIVVSGITAPTKRENIIKIRQPGVLENCIEQWLNEFDTVIIDTSPLNRLNAQNIPAERVAAACDGALMIVLAGQTSESSINSAMSKLNNAGAFLLGSVLNDRYNPTLKAELIREVQRIPRFFNWLHSFLNKMINKSRLLTLEV